VGWRGGAVGIAILCGLGAQANKNTKIDIVGLSTPPPTRIVTSHFYYLIHFHE
jgi:hypothetical protein